MSPRTRYAKQHTKASKRRRLKAQERLARDRRQAQRAAEALLQALDDLGLPEDLVTEIEGRLRSQKKLLGKIIGVGRVPPDNGSCVELSLMPSQRGQSAGHAHLKQVLKPLSSPGGLHLDTPGMRNATMLTSRQFLDRLRLRPWGHPKAQHLVQRPHVVGQAGSHRGCSLLPAVDGRRALRHIRQRRAQAGVRQHKIVIHLA